MPVLAFPVSTSVLFALRPRAGTGPEPGTTRGLANRPRRGIPASIDMKTARYWLPFVPAFLGVNLLCYLDEGYRDFRWMREPGNWIAFALYLAVAYGLLLAGTLATLRLAAALRDRLRRAA